MYKLMRNKSRCLHNRIREVSWQKLLLGIITTIMILCLPLSLSFADQAPTSIYDEETVYVLLDHNGAVENEIVVDYLRLTGTGRISVTDFGSLTGIKNLMGSVKPIVKDNSITWDINANGGKNLFYSGKTDKELPVAVAIKYYLNDKEVKANQIAGKKGKLRVEIAVKNKLKNKQSIVYSQFGSNSLVSSEEEIYTPLMTIVTLDVPRDKFDEVRADDAMTTMVGGTMKCTWMVMPVPEETIVMEMTGDKLELEPIAITVMPQMPQVAGLEIAEQLEEMSSNLGMINELEGMIPQLSFAAGGLSQLGTLVNGQIGITQNLNASTGLAASGLNDLQQLNAGHVQLTQTLESSTGDLANGVAGLEQVNQGQVDLLNSIENSNSDLMTLALTLDKGDPIVQQLVADLADQQNLLSTLKNGGSIGGQILPGLTTTGQGLSDTKDALYQIQGTQLILINGGDVQGQYIPGLTTMGSSLGQSASGLGQMGDTLGVLEKGGKLQGQYIPGLITVRNGLLQASSQFSSGMNSFNLDDIESMEADFEDAINQMNKGEAIQDNMQTLADEYDTFMGKPNNASGKVSFVMKTDAIKTEDSNAKDGISNNRDKNTNSEGLVGRIILVFVGFTIGSGALLSYKKQGKSENKTLV